MRSIHLTYHTDFKLFLLHALWYDDRAIQLLKFSMSQEFKKGPIAALTFESSKNFISTYFQKLMWFYLLSTKDIWLGNVWWKTFFRCEMPVTAPTDIATYHYQVILKIIIKFGYNARCHWLKERALWEFIVKFGYNVRCHWLKERAQWEYRA